MKQKKQKQILLTSSLELSSSGGFALLYTVVIISLLLTIAISISDTSLKQGVLSGLAKDSQIAFYQADAGAECALYYDVALAAFPFGGGTPPPGTMTCGSASIPLTSSTGSYFIYETTTGSAPCFSVRIDKSNPAQTKIESRGHNICGASPRQVERAIKVRY